MKYSRKELEALPDVFNLQTFRVTCHISKRVAAYYLNNGVIPCTMTGKKTHSYLIRKIDLLEAIARYEMSPELFLHPPILSKSRIRPNRVNFLPDEDVGNKTVMEYYRRKYQDESDLLSRRDVTRLTGYTAETVSGWCASGKIRFYCRAPKIWIPKKVLIEYVTSPDYNRIMKKSQIHRDEIKEIFGIMYGIGHFSEEYEDETQNT